MKVLIAGATGAIGASTARVLRQQGDEVIGLTRSATAASRWREVWAGAVVADALDRPALLAAARDVRADVVLHELTAISGFPRRYRDLDQTNRLRVEGTDNLVALAEQVGASRLVTQSFLGGYGYRDHRPVLQGRHLTEEDPFGEPDENPGRAAIVHALGEAERLTLTTPGLDGVVLRYGALYGGASLTLMAQLLRKRQLPAPAGGGGVLSFLSLPDAGTATAAAVHHGLAGQVYNACDDHPEQWGAFLDEAARSVQAPRPLRAPGWLLRLAAPYGYDFMSSSIPMSNAKLRRDTGWTPAAPHVRDGLAAEIGASR
jgi:nucleoside-diphosphate-sugar epimerase